MSESWTWASGMGGGGGKGEGGGGTGPWLCWREGCAPGRQSSVCHKLHVSPSIAAVVLQGVISCWYQRARETIVCRAQGKMQVKSGHLSGLGMKGPVEIGLGRLGVLHLPSSPLSILLPCCLPGSGLKRGAVDFCAPESSLSRSFLSCCLPVPVSSGGPGQLVVPKDGAVGVARAVRGDYFCCFVKNKTKAVL